MVESAPAKAHSRLRVLDGLRLLAALSVVFFHYTSANSMAWGRPVGDVFPPLQEITVYGALGVHLFFMISGFVVLMSAWGRTLPQFAASRVARLYPAYWLGVFVAGAVLFFTAARIAGSAWSDVGPKGFLVNLTMLQTGFGIPHVDGVYWTLWVELKFYVLLGVLVVIGITRRRVIALCIAWPVLAVIALLVNNPYLTLIVDPQYVPFFTLGMLVFLIRRDGLTWVTSGLVIGNWAFAMYLTGRFAEGLRFATDGTISQWVVAGVLTFALIALIVATLTPVGSVNWGWLTIAGALTYPLYLLHDVTGSWVISVLPRAWPPVLTLLLVVGLMCLAAYGVNRLIERPFGPRLRRAVERLLEWRPRRAQKPDA